MDGVADEIVEGCHVGSDEGVGDGQTVFVEYPTLYPSGDVAYVVPRVRIEAGARSALDPSLSCTVSPYVADELPDWSFDVSSIRVSRRQTIGCGLRLCVNSARPMSPLVSPFPGVLSVTLRPECPR